MIALIDYGMGNLGSIANMIRKMGGQSTIVQTPDQLAACTKAILPGVGSFDTAMSNLSSSGLKDALHQFALIENKPLLGICLGMQVMCNGSEEGKLPGLGWIDAEVKKFNFEAIVPKNNALKIPHMGWNVVLPTDCNWPLFKDWEAEMRFYFVHSYAVHCKNEAESKAKTTFGYAFDSAIGKNNIMGMQFHPEKSHRFGMKVYKNFIDLP